MQNIDFSKQFKRGPSVSENRPAPESVPDQGDYRELKKKNRTYIFSLVFSLISFTAGLFAGLQLNRVKHIEENLIKYPDEKRENLPVSHHSGGERGSGAPTPGETIQFSDRSPLSGEGRFIIKMGTFSTNKSEDLATRLNNLPELARIPPLKCRKVKESVPGRYLAFRTRVSETKENLLLGCFASESEAREVLRVVLESKIPDSDRARLYEID